MVIRQGNIFIFDNFKAGIATPPQPPTGEKFIHLSFTEQDFEDERMNPTYIFKIHEKQVDLFVEMVREAQGKKSLHIPTPGEMPNGSQV